MTANVTELKTSSTPATARGGALPLTNVAIAFKMMERALEPWADPGMQLFYGKTGWGKTCAVTAAKVRYQAAYLELAPNMSRKAFYLGLLGSHSASPVGKTIDDYRKQLVTLLLDWGGALIIDEADYLTHGKLTDELRWLHDKTHTPVILVGEEKIDGKLRKFEQFHGRILDFHMAQPCSLEDGRKLASHYGRGLIIEDDLVAEVVTQAELMTRRITANFTRMRHFATAAGIDVLDLATWEGTGEGYITGNKPTRPGEGAGR